MNCRDLSGFLEDYFAGELPEPVSAEFSTHLSGCGNCTVFIEQYRQTIVAGRTICTEEETIEVPAELVEAIVAALKAVE